MTYKTRIVTTRYLMTSLICFIIGIGLTIAMIYSWSSFASIGANTDFQTICEQVRGCSTAMAFGVIIWAISNLALCILAAICIFWFLIGTDDLPIIKVRGKPWFK